MFRKIFSVFILFLLFSTYIYSLTWKDITFTAGASTDYYSGEVREIVYPGTGWTNNYLSELIWQIDNIAMLNAHLGASLNKFSLNISAGTALNKGTGEMDDYDWGDYSITDWTNWSNSDIFLDKSFILDTSLTYSIKPNTNTTIPIGIGYKLNYLNWSDKAGKYIYFWDFTNNNYFPNVQAGNFGGIPGINYTFVQNIPLITVGISFRKKAITGKINASYSPFIYAWDLDHHIMRGFFFLDTFNANHWYQLKVEIGYNDRRKGKLFCSLQFEELPEIKGDTSVYNEDPADPTKTGTPAGSYKDAAGLASKILTISIGYKYQF